ncbi:hypothetical protein GCM10009638_25600 [Luteococcus sanguinis]
MRVSTPPTKNRALKARALLRARITPEERARLAALDRQIASEDETDSRREFRRIRAGLPEPPREVIRTFPGWAESGATHTGLA